jgi:ketosteroid isomerase-like protein
VAEVRELLEGWWGGYGSATRYEVESMMADDRTTEHLDLEAARRSIEDLEERFMTAHVAGDSAAIDALFTRDAVSYPPGAPAAIGAAAINDLTLEYTRSGITEARNTMTHCFGNADFVVVHGTYRTVNGPDGNVECGKYVNVWKGVDGTRKLHVNIWNTAS